MKTKEEIVRLLFYKSNNPQTTDPPGTIYDLIYKAMDEWHEEIERVRLERIVKLRLTGDLYGVCTHCGCMTSELAGVRSSYGLFCGYLCQAAYLSTNGNTPIFTKSDMIDFATYHISNQSKTTWCSGELSFVGWTQRSKHNPTITGDFVWVEKNKSVEFVPSENGKITLNKK